MLGMPHGSCPCIEITRRLEDVDRASKSQGLDFTFTGTPSPHALPTTCSYSRARSHSSFYIAKPKGLHAGTWITTMQPEHNFGPAAGTTTRCLPPTACRSPNSAASSFMGMNQSGL